MPRTEPLQHVARRHRVGWRDRRTERQRGRPPQVRHDDEQHSGRDRGDRHHQPDRLPQHRNEIPQRLPRVAEERRVVDQRGQEQQQHQLRGQLHLRHTGHEACGHPHDHVDRGLRKSGAIGDPSADQQPEGDHHRNGEDLDSHDC
jgi:hypothetical protein